MTEHAELNAFLAEHVMGWEHLPSAFDPPHYIRYQRQDGSIAFLPGGEVTLGPRWDPASRPEQALEVAEKLNQEPTEPVLSLTGPDTADGTPPGSRWDAVFHDIEGELSEGQAERPALAVCLAARAWVEGRKGGE